MKYHSKIWEDNKHKMTLDSIIGFQILLSPQHYCTHITNAFFTVVLTRLSWPSFKSISYSNYLELPPPSTGGWTVHGRKDRSLVPTVFLLPQLLFPFSYPFWNGMEDQKKMEKISCHHLRRSFKHLLPMGFHVESSKFEVHLSLDILSL